MGRSRKTLPLIGNIRIVGFDVRNDMIMQCRGNGNNLRISDPYLDMRLYVRICLAYSKIRTLVYMRIYIRRDRILALCEYRNMLVNLHMPTNFVY